MPARQDSYHRDTAYTCRDLAVSTDTEATPLNEAFKLSSRLAAIMPELSSGLSRIIKPSSEERAGLATRLWSQLPSTKSVLDQLHTGKSSNIELAITAVQSARIELEGILDLEQRTCSIPAWMSSFSRRSEARRAYKEQWSSTYADVKKIFPDFGFRASRRLTGELMQYKAMRKVAGEIQQDSEQGGKLLSLLRYDLNKIDQVRRRDNYALRPLLYSLVATLGCCVGYEAGMLPDLPRYLSRDEQGVVQDAADEFRQLGCHTFASELENIGIRGLREQAFINSGLTTAELEQFGRKDKLNHLGAFTTISLGPKYMSFSGKESHGSALPTFDAIKIDGADPQLASIRHELWHREGHFKETSWIRRSLYDGPLSEIEEGLCNIAGKGMAAGYEDTNALNVTLIAMLLGMPEGGIQTGDDALSAYQSGLRTLNLAFVKDHSIEPVQTALDQRYGPGAFERIIISGYSDQPYAGRGLVAELFATLEDRGCNGMAVLQALEDSYCAATAWSESPDGFVALQGSFRINLVTDSAHSEHLAIERALDLAAAHPDTSISDLYRLIGFYSALDNGTNSERLDGYHALKEIVDGDRGNGLWAQGGLLLIKYGLNSGFIESSDASSLMQQVVAKFPDNDFDGLLEAARGRMGTTALAQSTVNPQGVINDPYQALQMPDIIEPTMPEPPLQAL